MNRNTETQGKAADMASLAQGKSFEKKKEWNYKSGSKCLNY